MDLAALNAAVAAHGRLARVLVAQVRGSAPREPGAEMLLWPGGQQGTIGGGRLEHEAAARALAQLAGSGEGSGGRPAVLRQPLGPALRQCCGGAVTLVTELFDAAALAALEAGPFRGARAVRLETGPAELPAALARRIAAFEARGAPVPLSFERGWLVEPLRAARLPVLICGAGHVGRALAGVLAPLPRLAVTLADARAEMFAAPLPDAVARHLGDPLAAVAAAPAGAVHYVMTHDHDLDLAICDALLRRGFARAGLIGSATKRARFASRLAALGHAPADIARIECPIGDPALGKHPQAIAVSVAAALLSGATAQLQRGARA